MNNSSANNLAAIYELVARIAFLNCQRDAMIAENELALRLGNALPYRDTDFYALARDFAELATAFRSIKQHVPDALGR